MLIDNFKKIEVEKDKTISDAIKILNYFSTKILLITNKNKQFIGTVTDGDIRRGFSKNCNLNTKINKITNHKSIKIYDFVESKIAKKIMQENSIFHLPVIDKKSKKIKGIYSLLSVEQKKISNTVIIMAGGKGKRLWPLTKNTPKPLLKIDNGPILKNIILNFKSQGFENFIVSVNYLKEKIINYLKINKNFGLNIRILKEKKFLGTGGPLGLIKKTMINEDPFIVINGDVLVDLDFNNLIDFHNKNKSLITIVVRKLYYQIPYGEIKITNFDIQEFKEKPYKFSFVNTGIYCVNFDAIKLLKKNEHIDMPQIIKKLMKKKYKVRAYPIQEDWHDIGNAEIYKSFSKNI